MKSPILNNINNDKFNMYIKKVISGEYFFYATSCPIQVGAKKGINNLFLTAYILNKKGKSMLQFYIPFKELLQKTKKVKNERAKNK